MCTYTLKYVLMSQVPYKRCVLNMFMAHVPYKHCALKYELMDHVPINTVP